MMIESFEVPTKRPRITFIADEDLRSALEAWAKEESRTISNLCELIVRKAAIETGRLKETQPDDSREDS